MSGRVGKGEGCKCEPNFTCRVCLNDPPPWFFTLSDGSAIATGRPQGAKA